MDKIRCTSTFVDFEGTSPEILLVKDFRMIWDIAHRNLFNGDAMIKVVWTGSQQLSNQAISEKNCDADSDKSDINNLYNGNVPHCADVIFTEDSSKI